MPDRAPLGAVASNRVSAEGSRPSRSFSSRGDVLPIQTLIPLEGNAPSGSAPRALPKAGVGEQGPGQRQMAATGAGTAISVRIRVRDRVGDPRPGPESASVIRDRKPIQRPRPRWRPGPSPLGVRLLPPSASLRLCVSIFPSVLPQTEKRDRAIRHPAPASRKANTIMLGVVRAGIAVGGGWVTTTRANGTSEESW